MPSSLKPCLDGRPHCFSSSPALELGGGTNAKLGNDWVLKPWSYKGITVLTALDDVKKAVEAYPPGQNGIDGGGFEIKNYRIPDRSEGDVAYLYVQFESEVRGYIDDVEFVLADGQVNVRSSSRTGYLDLGVNAKRLNWLAKRLGSVKGWSTVPVRQKEHPDYFAQNDLTDKDVGL